MTTRMMRWCSLAEHEGIDQLFWYQKQKGYYRRGVELDQFHFPLFLSFFPYWVLNIVLLLGHSRNQIWICVVVRCVS